MAHVPPPLTQAKAQELADQFWPKVGIGPRLDCWPWRGTIIPGGYGQFWAWKRTHGAHRIAYALGNGDIPEGAYILHRCDNRACCNPAHLFLGDHVTNMRDMHAKGRFGGGRRKAA